MHAKWDTDFMKRLGGCLFRNYEGNIFKWEFIFKIMHYITQWFDNLIKGDLLVRAKVWGSNATLFKGRVHPKTKHKSFE